MNHDKTFQAISKLKDIEVELHRLKNALELANKALTQPEQKPVAYWNGKDWFICADTAQYISNWSDYYPEPLYTAPPKREWVGLTQDEIDDICQRNTREFTEQAKLIETKLKEKNGY